MLDASEQRAREPISTRIERDALEVIAKVAAEWRTTPAQVARVLLEDGVRMMKRVSPISTPLANRMED